MASCALVSFSGESRGPEPLTPSRSLLTCCAQGINIDTLLKPLICSRHSDWKNHYLWTPLPQSLGSLPSLYHRKQRRRWPFPKWPNSVPRLPPPRRPRPVFPARAMIQLSTNSFQNDRLPGKNEHRLGRGVVSWGIPGQEEDGAEDEWGRSRKKWGNDSCISDVFRFLAKLPVSRANRVVCSSSLTWSILPHLKVEFRGIHFASFAKAADKVHF